MKKALVVMGLLMVSVAYALDDEYSVMFQHPGNAVVEEVPQENKLINYDAMNKSDKIDTAMKNNEEKKAPSTRLKLDTKQIQHQRALDFSSRYINSMPLPL